MIDLFNKKKLEEICELYNKTEKMNDDLLRSNSKLIKISEDLLANNNKLIRENKELIEWIDKMINEVGVKINNNYEGSTITIPYSEKIKPYYIEGDWNKSRGEQKHVIIPSIRFTKFEYKED